MNHYWSTDPTIATLTLCCTEHWIQQSNMDKRNFLTKQHSQCQQSLQKPTPITSTVDPLGTLSRNFTRHKLGNNSKWDTGNVSPVLCKNGGVKQNTREMSFHSFWKYHTQKHQPIYVQKKPSYITVHELQHKNISRNISLFKNLNTCKISKNEGVCIYQDTSVCNESILSLNTSWSLLSGCPTKLMIRQITWQSYAMS